MKRIRHLRGMLVALAMLHAPPAAGQEVKLAYVVRKGDTLAKIAAKFNVDVDSVLKWNADKLLSPAAAADGEPAAKAAPKSYPKVITPGTRLKIPKKDENGKGIVHKVAPGETFTTIAQKYGVSKYKLLRWNKKTLGLLGGEEGEGTAKKKKPACVPAAEKGAGKGTTKGKGKGKGALPSCAETAGGKLAAGMQLVIFAKRPAISSRVAVYRAAAWDTPLELAKRFGAKAEHIMDYNFMVKGERFAKGDLVEIPLEIPDHPSESVGSPTGGSLRGGERMPDGPGWLLKSPSFAYGTNETVTALVNCIGAVEKEHPWSGELVIGHLSKKKGGKFRPHKSHASGRDVDVGYYYKGVAPKKFMKVKEASFDLERTVTFMTCLAETGQVQYMFVEYYVQKLIHAYMKSLKKYSDDFIAGFLQYPRSPDKREGLVREEEGHDNHIHVRFLCPKNDPDCVD